MYQGFWLWEARSVVFDKGLRFWEPGCLTKLWPRGGPLKKDLTCVGGSELGSYEDLMNVSRILALGGWICRVLRGSEALGGLSF